MMFITLLLTISLFPDYMTFSLEKDFIRRRQRQTVYMVFQDINEAIGCQYLVLKTTASLDTHGNFITFNPNTFKKTQKGYLGLTHMGKERIRISLRRGLRNERLYNTMLHELGHVLGLPHAPDKRNIMYPFADDAIPVVSNHKKVKKYLKYRWIHQITDILKEQHPEICPKTEDEQ